MNQFPRPSVLTLVAANLIPLFGVFWLGWDAFSLLLLFWLENVVIGFFNVLRMLVIQEDRRQAKATKLFLIPFFIFHFGAFTMGHGFLLFEIFSQSVGSVGFDLSNLLAAAWAQIKVRHLEFSLGALFVSHGVSFVTNTLAGGEFRRLRLAKQMFRPYLRIAIMHVAVLFGAILAQKTGNKYWALVILVGVKLAVDLRSHLAERSSLSREKVV